MFGMGTGVTLAAKPPTKRNGFGKICCRIDAAGVKPVWYEEWLIVHWTSQAARAISTARLRMLPLLHLQPINVLVSNGPSEGLPPGKIRLEGGFPLRCFQRFSGPDIATRRCLWQDSRYTRGQSVPVLSY